MGDIPIRFRKVTSLIFSGENSCDISSFLQLVSESESKLHGKACSSDFSIITWIGELLRDTNRNFYLHHSMDLSQFG